MSYQFSVTIKAGYLHCVVQGENSVENVSRYLNDVYQSCVKHECPDVLIEENLTGPSLGITDIYYVISQGSLKTWPYVRRIAYVDNNPEHSEGNMKFAETVAQNRGVHVRFFPTVQEAEKWLTGGTSE